MSGVSREQRYETEHAVYVNNGDAGARTIRNYLQFRRSELNDAWPTKTGDELVAIQGEARAIEKLIRLIEHGPTIKKTTEAPSP